MSAEEPTGRARGGHAAAKAMTKEQLAERGRKAADARWGADLPQAYFEGDVKIAGRMIPSAVLQNGKRLLSQGQFLQAIGRSRTPKAGSGVMAQGVDGLPFFLQAEALKPFIDNDLRESTTPYFYRSKKGKRTAGFDATLLPKVCEVYLKLRDESLAKDGKVPAQYAHIIKACDALMRGLAEVGIIALVDEATGYQYVRDREALQEILEKYLRKELAVWVKTFPDEFYKEMYRLRGWEWRGMHVNRISACAGYTRDLVYERLQPNLLRELEQRNPIEANGRRKSKLFQWLSDDIGEPALKTHLHTVTNFMRAYDTWDEFYERLGRVLPRRGTTYEMSLSEPSNALSPPDALDSATQP